MAFEFQWFIGATICWRHPKGRILINQNKPNTPCPVCGTEEATEHRGTSDHFGISYCLDCQLQYADPMEEPGESFYANCSLYESRENSGPLHGAERDWRYRTGLKLFANGKRQSLLDIGCGEGGFLALASDRGFNVSDLDVDPRAVELARTARDIKDVRHGTWIEPEDMNGWKDFDRITLFEVSTVEKLQGQKIACIEEIAYRMRFINRAQIDSLFDEMPDNPYKEYHDEVVGG